MPTLYELLGVPEQATPTELRRAYRQIMLLTHPDRTPDPAAHQRYLLVNEAYEILSQPARRQAYDALLARQRQPPPVVRPTAPSAPPYARRRPPVVVQQRRSRPSTEVDLRPYNRPAMLWCRVLLGLPLLLLLDFFALQHTVQTQPIKLDLQRTRSGEAVNYVVTRQGSFSTSQDFPDSFPPLQLQTSRLFHFVREVRLPDGSRLPIGFEYGTIMSFAGLLLLLTGAAQVRGVGPSMRVNLAIVATVLGVIVALLAVFST